MNKRKSKVLLVMLVMSILIVNSVVVFAEGEPGSKQSTRGTSSDGYTVYYKVEAFISAGFSGWESCSQVSSYKNNLYKTKVPIDYIASEATLFYQAKDGSNYNAWQLDMDENYQSGLAVDYTINPVPGNVPGWVWSGATGYFEDDVYGNWAISTW